MRFDKRLGKRGQKLYSDRFLNRQRTSVLHLEMVAEWRLLTSYMNGDLMTFDLRFTREASPLVQYHGHHNTYTQRLGIAVDPTHDFLFAAGEDCRIRAWSVHTGQSLVFSSSDNDTHNPFVKVFSGVIETMQVTSEPQGLCLWAGHDQTLHKIYLGQR
ncbi:hypothetical protein C0993_005441 [Termitomyces sp. T159_Od127]|nr:hypothetical protein C0993_005441 [Termitomyces sp. T159_Od127]